MRTILKYAAGLTLTGALALAIATPGQAREGRHTAAAVGFGAGALVGAAAVNANRGYYASGYYDPNYAYAYEPAPTYGPAWRHPAGGACGVSPASFAAVACD
jgi:hypothetical protein